MPLDPSHVNKCTDLSLIMGCYRGTAVGCQTGFSICWGGDYPSEGLHFLPCVMTHLQEEPG